MANGLIRLIAGLGNPGSAYAQTRHNAGFMVVDALAEQYGIPWKSSRYDAAFGRGRVEGCDVLLVKPMAYMNRSGPPLRRVADYFRIQCGEMLVVYDDMDLAFGRVKIMEKGGHGGHKGVKSIMDAFGGGDFPRLRVGVGRPQPGQEATDHVLRRFDEAQQAVLGELIGRASEAAVTVLCNGTVEGMNRFNDKRMQMS
ncbi:MAG: aminoacyl-tRNA hydrolase [Desulfobacteraceae bacterium]|jgi:PTH1 family peptidyl-tRNA hydrolase|nr:aminoacyl-tRNA hydrolase [Desulfobacteraceae bacterium]